MEDNKNLNVENEKNVEVKGNEEVKPTNLFQKLLVVRKRVPYLQKTEKGNQYQYVGSSQVLSSLRDELDKQGLLLFPHVLKTNLITYQTTNSKGGTRNNVLTELWLEYEWIDSETGESKRVPFYAQGLDFEGEKGVGKALTYAEKYFLLKQFNIATDKDDPDYHQNKIDSTLPNFITDSQAKELTQYMEQYAKSCGVPVDSVIQQFGVTMVDKIQAANYQHVRNTLLSWINTSAQQQPSSVQNQVNHQQPMNEQYTQPNSNVGMFTQPTQDNAQQMYIIQNVEEGTSPNHVPFAKLQVVNMSTQEANLVFANGEENVQKIRSLPWNTPLPLQINNQNGFHVFGGVA